MNSVLLLSLALLGAPAGAQESGVPDTAPSSQQAQPVQNINGGANPTAAAILPSTYVGGQSATYPAAGNQPSFRGGTTGDNPDLQENSPNRQERERYRRRRERANGEPGRPTHTSTPPNENVSPGAPANDINPGAFGGGPQP